VLLKLVNRTDLQRVCPATERPTTTENGGLTRAAAAQSQVTFEAAYRACFAFVYRNAKRLGVRDSSVDDVVQEVFLVVHRRLAEYDDRLSLRGWIYGILSHVVRSYRRTLRRRELPIVERDSESLCAAAPAGPPALEPARLAEHHEAVRLLMRILDRLDDDKREVLVLSELEQMTVPEIAGALGANLNTIYSRLSAAKRAFAEAHAREKARLSRGGRHE
jgi:RNA polymerase sigma-70 factor (ECF subfamily)